MLAQGSATDWLLGDVIVTPVWIVASAILSLLIWKSNSLAWVAFWVFILLIAAGVAWRGAVMRVRAERQAQRDQRIRDQRTVEVFARLQPPPPPAPPPQRGSFGSATAEVSMPGVPVRKQLEDIADDMARRARDQAGRAPHISETSSPEETQAYMQAIEDAKRDYLSRYPARFRALQRELAEKGISDPVLTDGMEKPAGLLEILVLSERVRALAERL